MKKEYISLEVELIFLQEQDIVTTSPGDNADVMGSDIFDD